MSQTRPKKIFSIKMWICLDTGEVLHNVNDSNITISEKLKHKQYKCKGTYSTETENMAVMLLRGIWVIPQTDQLAQDVFMTTYSEEFDITKIKEIIQLEKKKNWLQLLANYPLNTPLENGATTVQLEFTYPKRLGERKVLWIDKNTQESINNFDEKNVFNRTEIPTNVNKKNNTILYNGMYQLPNGNTVEVEQVMREAHYKKKYRCQKKRSASAMQEQILSAQVSGSVTPTTSILTSTPSLISLSMFPLSIQQPISLPNLIVTPQPDNK